MVLLAAIVCVIFSRVLEMALADLIGWWQTQKEGQGSGAPSGLESSRLGGEF
jgi:hypothetical protein